MTICEVSKRFNRLAQEHGVEQPSSLGLTVDNPKCNQQSDHGYHYTWDTFTNNAYRVRYVRDKDGTGVTSKDKEFPLSEPQPDGVYWRFTWPDGKVSALKHRHPARHIHPSSSWFRAPGCQKTFVSPKP